MSAPKREKDPQTGEPYCGAPMAVHFAAMLALLADHGIGFDCRDVYRGLVEVAEFYRQVGGFQPYTASTEDAADVQVTPGATTAQAYIARQKASFGSSGDEVIEGEATPVDAGLPQDEDAVRLRRAYDALTPEQKKRFS